MAWRPKRRQDNAAANPPPTPATGPSPNRLGRSANDFSPDIAAFATVEPYDAAKRYVGGISDPWAAQSGTLHAMDPYTAIPCEATKIELVTSLPIHNGSSAADGSVTFMLRGDTYFTIYLPLSVDASHNVTWVGGTPLSTYGSYTSNYYHRPVVTYARVRIFQSAEPHSVCVSTYRITPGVTATQLAACPAKTNDGVTTDQRTWLQGAEAEIPVDASIDLVTHASRGTAEKFSWSAVAAERGSSGFQAFAFKAFGLRSTDRVELIYGSHAEYTPAASTMPLTPSLISTVIPSATASSLALAASETKTNVGADVVVNRAADNAVSSKKTVDKIDRVLNDARVKDTLSKGIDAITDIVTGDWLGAATNVFSIAKKWIFGIATTPTSLTLTDGSKVVLPPLVLRYASVPPALANIRRLLEGQGSRVERKLLYDEEKEPGPRDEVLRQSESLRPSFRTATTPRPEPR